MCFTNIVTATTKKSSIKKPRVKSSTKANAERHNSEVKRNIFNKVSKCLLILK